MANRAYLYAQKGAEMISISEYNYDIPITYKILVAQHTKRVRSKIFKSPFKTAIKGDFEKGVERLYAFLDELRTKDYFEEKVLEEKIEETKAFLEKKHGCSHFYLEGAEIYELDSNPILGSLRMKNSISNINKEIKSFYGLMDEMKKEQEDKNNMMAYIGIQEWSDYLYYER